MKRHCGSGERNHSHLSQIDGMTSGPTPGITVTRSLDPQDCLGGIVRGEASDRGSAESAIFAWVLGLPRGIDPAAAASSLTASWPFNGFAGLGDERERLLSLLEEVACYPANRLAQLHVRRGRRRTFRTA